jgi:hypothetical protein
MSIVCEIIIVFTCFRSEKDSCCYRWLIAIGAVIFLFISFWQYRVLFDVDFEIVANPGQNLLYS